MPSSCRALTQKVHAITVSECTEVSALAETTARGDLMRGPLKPRRLDKPIAVSLEDMVRANYFYRYLDAKLDLSFTRDCVATSMPIWVDGSSTRSSSSNCNWSCSSQASAPITSSWKQPAATSHTAGTLLG
jgi:hypothetical protein